MKPTRSMVISIIGRPNVGKSSLFNRLMKRQHKAITHDMPGVTRDRHYGIATFDDLGNELPRDAILVDTGGFYPEKVDISTGKNTEMNGDKFFNIMTNHAKQAIEESDLVLFVVDVREGSLPFDEVIAKSIRGMKKPYWLIINKYDSDAQAGEEAEFYALGVDPEKMFTCSSSHGLGIVTLREKIHEEICAFENKNNLSPELQRGVTPREEVVGRIALIGAPNAGKSTLLNKLLGSERALVSDIPGTTVDPIEGFFDLYFGKEAKLLEEEQSFSNNDGLLLKTYEDFRKNNKKQFETMLEAYAFEEGEISEDSNDEMVFEYEENGDDLDKTQDVLFNDQNESEGLSEVEEVAEVVEDEGSFWRSMHLVDTAGIRRKTSVEGTVESQSVFRSLRCITESDIVVFMIDATKGISHQDRRLMDIALEKGKSIIICMNKMDLMRSILKTDEERKEWLEDMRFKIPWLTFCDVLPISAKSGAGLKRLKQSLKKTVLVRRLSIPTGSLNRTVYGLVERNPVIVKKSGGRRLKIKYASMVKSDPPTFLFFSNRSKGIPENYKRYLKNNLRREFELVNTPVHLVFRTGTDLEKRMKKINISK
ncbi:MAG: 50S ribosome-binding GTPase [Bacteriovoracaceae bacterium]|nr:50S ribosome-binding GTPase [Bacteriovoracaceae bacterium]